MTLSIVTVSTHFPPESYFTVAQFYASAHKYGFNPIVLSEGYKGLGTKPRMLQKAIESGKVTADYIAFTDCWDLVWAKDPSTNVPKDKIIFGAEKNCWPDAKLADKFPETKSPYRYLNSGFSIGPTQLYLQALKEMKAMEMPSDTFVDGKWTHYEDQGPWQHEYLFGNTPIGLDVNHELVHNLAGVTMDEVDLNNPPVCYHWNGGAKTNGTREPILKHLGL